jgi:hypothetical protein
MKKVNIMKIILVISIVLSILSSPDNNHSKKISYLISGTKATVETSKLIKAIIQIKAYPLIPDITSYKTIPILQIYDYEVTFVLKLLKWLSEILMLDFIWELIKKIFYDEPTYEEREPISHEERERIRSEERERIRYEQEQREKQAAVELVRSYYGNLNRNEANTAIRKWKYLNKDRRKMRRNIRNADWFRINHIELYSFSSYYATVSIDVTGKQKRGRVQRWEGKIDLEKVSGNWKIIKLRLSTY